MVLRSLLTSLIMKLKTLLLATSWAALSSFSVQALQETAEKEEVQSPPSLPGEVHSKIDSATPGLMPVKPLKDVPEDILALLDALPEAKREFVLSGKGVVYASADRFLGDRSFSIGSDGPYGPSRFSETNTKKKALFY